jgi:hypothetical protein
MKNLKKRLDALEQAEQAQSQRDARFTADLMFSYATDEERAAWEAAGRPAVRKWEQVLDQVYAESV